ncbi:MAG: hypothetical protein MJ192_04185 [Clostridia bacterium]|nr:hypothetical protein [Clostridia bacterium]
MAEFASAIQAKYELPVNAISGKFPPEYPCDKERIVVLAVSAKSEMPDDLRRFCGELNKTRAYNVALLVDGKQADADKIADIIKAAGTNLVGVKVITIPGFLFFGGNLTEELKAELIKWVEDMVAACK